MVRDSLIVYAPDEKPLAVSPCFTIAAIPRSIAAVLRSRLWIRFGVQRSQARGCIVCTRFRLRGYLNTVVARRSVAG